MKKSKLNVQVLCSAKLKAVFKPKKVTDFKKSLKKVTHFLTRN